MGNHVGVMEWWVGKLGIAWCSWRESVAGGAVLVVAACLVARLWGVVDTALDVAIDEQKSGEGGGVPESMEGAMACL